jgi:hypothetical protein
VNRLLRGGHGADRLGADQVTGNRELPAGTFVLRADAADFRQLAAETGLSFYALESDAAVAELELLSIRAPAVGVYRGWVPSMDEGWGRWVLEQYGFDYVSLTDAQLRAGGLDELDAIVLPHQSAEDLLHGHPPGTMPEEFTGGIGLEGALNLKRWVEAGGTLIAIDGASDFVIDQFGLPVRNAVRDIPPESLSVPASLVRLEVDRADPIGFGVPEETVAFFVGSRAFEMVELAGEESAGGRDDVVIVARYGDSDILLSGWELGADEHLAGQPAVVRATLGRGQVVLIGFRSHFRAQPRATFKLLFNSLFAATAEPSSLESVTGSE